MLKEILRCQRRKEKEYSYTLNRYKMHYLHLRYWMTFSCITNDDDKLSKIHFAKNTVVVYSVIIVFYKGKNMFDMIEIKNKLAIYFITYFTTYFFFKYIL